jgi:hypothetical protein
MSLSQETWDAQDLDKSHVLRFASGKFTLAFDHLTHTQDHFLTKQMNLLIVGLVILSMATVKNDTADWIRKGR